MYDLDRFASDSSSTTFLLHPKQVIYCKFILATLYVWVFNGMNLSHEEPLGKNDFIEKRKTK